MRTIIFVLIVSMTLTLASSSFRAMLDLISLKPIDSQFKLWHYVMRRPYDLNSQEATLRFKNFKENVRRINELNAKNLGFTVGIGLFSDEDFSDDSKDYSSSTYSNKINVESGKIDFDVMADMIDNESDNSIRLLTESQDWSYLFENDLPVTDFTDNKNNSNFIYDSNHVNQLMLSYTLNANAKISNEFKGKSSAQHLRNCVNEGKEEKGKVYSILRYMNIKRIPLESDVPKDKKVGPCVDTDIFSVYDFRWSKCNDSYRELCNDNLLKGLIIKGPYASSLVNSFAISHYTGGIVTTEECQRSSSLGVIVTEINKDYIKALLPFGYNYGEKGYIKVKNESVGQPEKSCGLKSNAYLPTEISFEQNKEKLA